MNLMNKFFFVRNFGYNKMSSILSLTFCGTLKYGCVIKTRNIFNFLPLMNNSVTI